MIRKIASLGLLALVPLALSAPARAAQDGDRPVTQEETPVETPPEGDVAAAQSEAQAGAQDAVTDEVVVAVVDAAAPAPPAPGPLLQIQATKILVGDGTVIENGVLVIQNGRITKVGADVAIDPRHPVLHHDGVLTAGMIASHSQMSVADNANETARTILPDARIAHAFRPSHSQFEKALAAGITSVVLSPTADNLVGGMTAVVKSTGGTVLRDGAHLALSFTTSALAGGGRPQQFFFGNAEGPTKAEDGGLENTESGSSGSRYPTSYAGAVRELSERFSDPQGVLARVVKGELPVLIEAWDRHEVVRAAQFAQRFSLRGAVRGAPLAGDEYVLAALQASGLGVIVGPYGEEQTTASLASVSALQKAGIPVGFALTGVEGSPDLLRVSATRAIAAGADPALVWKALTSDAARLAGVDSRIGLLAPGRDADVVLWSGHPLNLTSRIEAVYVDGKRVHGGASR